MPAPERVVRLVSTFREHLSHYKSGAYNEMQLRREFLDPLFGALGWDISNEAGYADPYKDVIHEDAIKIGGASRAPDYCFRIGGTRKFFLEAKRPQVDIVSGASPAYQLRRYAWSAKLPLSILSDFEEFAVYDTRLKPVPTDRSTTARVFYCTYDKYEDSWDTIAGIFSRDAVLRGSFDKYADTSKRKRGTAEVDDAFLEEIERWRELLAKNFALRNPHLNALDLNFAVQKTIDRIVFLRICEDRGTEDYGRLQQLTTGADTYCRLRELFLLADARYNSGLFHFAHERGERGAPDTFSLDLALDDKPLRDILRNLYYPDSPYEFSVLPADILGQVYERFLGKTITLTAGHHARVEMKPEIRKAGGVYYTPTYVVDHIVAQTLGRLLNGPDPAHPNAISIARAAEITILDPACGSGSFLVAAYQYLLDWHLDRYVEKADYHTRGKSPRIHQSRGGAYRLTTNERKRILINSIYGVDIDRQAVEVTKLSLLLKVLEGETQQVIQRDWVLERQRALPDLGSNIMCGNSLVGSDFFDNERMLQLDDDSQFRINAFDWNRAFPRLAQHGGVDCIIGNPPWGATIDDSSSKYLAERYARVVDRMVDTYVYFIDRCLRLLAPGKLLGLVVPATMLNQTDTFSVRRLLLAEGVHELVNLGAGVFGKEASNTTLVLVASRKTPPERVYLHDLSTTRPAAKAQRLKEGALYGYNTWRELVTADSQLTFFTSDLDAARLLMEIQRSWPPLSSVLEGTIQRGVTPDCAEMHIVDSCASSQIEPGVLRASLSADQIKPYCAISSGSKIIYTTQATDIAQFPNARNHMEAFRSRLTCKEIASGTHPWWRLHRPRSQDIFRSPKFIGLTTSRQISIVYDSGQDLVVTDACYVFRTDSHYDYRYLLGVFHSSLFSWMYRTANQGDGRIIPQVKAAKLVPLPIRTIDFDSPPDVAKHDKMVMLVDRMLGLHARLAKELSPDTCSQLAAQIASTAELIDRHTYDLYGLSAPAIQIVERPVDRD